MPSFKFRNPETGEFEKLRGGVPSMLPSVYDPQGKKTDIFQYADDAVKTAITEHNEDPWAHSDLFDSLWEEIPNYPVDLGAATNPNLLDNWYFGNPVNQRGLSTYTGLGYTVDRWKLETYDGASAHVRPEGYLELEGNGIAFSQTLDPSLFAALLGKTVRFSALFADGTVRAASTVVTNDSTVTLWTYAGGVCGVIYPEGKITIRSFDKSAYNIKLVAVKLELGTRDTLAIRDPDLAKYVLVDAPPNKDLELLKCCMSTADPDDEYANNNKTADVIGAGKGSGVTVHTATIGTTWTEDGDTGVKSQNVAIEGVTASNTATVDHVFTAGTEYADFVEAENQYLTYITNGYAETYDGGVTFHIFGDAPTVAIPIVVEVV